MQIARLGKSVNFVGLDVDLSGLYALAAPSRSAEVVEEVVGRGRAGETITHRTVIEAEAAHAVRVHYVESAPMRSTVATPYYVPADQPAAEARTITYVRGETEDPAASRIRAASREVRRSLSAIAYALAVHQIGAIIATWDDDERERVRKNIEAVDRLKAALDRDNVVRFPDKPN
jgi:hypothetical protein